MRFSEVTELGLAYAMTWFPRADRLPETAAGLPCVTPRLLTACTEQSGTRQAKHKPTGAGQHSEPE